MSIDYDTWLLTGMEEYYGTDSTDEDEDEEPDFEDPPLSRYD